MTGLTELRDSFHRQLIDRRALALRNEIPTIADAASATSRAIAQALVSSLVARLGVVLSADVLSDQAQGSVFAGAVKDFVATVLDRFQAGRWLSVSGGSIDRYAQYAHLAEVQHLVDQYPELRSTLGGDYIIAPDVIVYREPTDDETLAKDLISDADVGLARSAFIRSRNGSALPIMHASVSCKWTLRSDRAQNARTEALNLIRLRKGRAPAIAVVTGEPMPSRLASLADGTGDVDRVYHFALYELTEAVDRLAASNPRVAGQKSDLDRMVRGYRLADISDLAFDLAT